MKVRKNITVNPDVWSQAEEKYGHGNVSKKIEELLEEDLDTEKTPDDINYLSHTNLTDRQKRLVRELIRQGKGEASFQEIHAVCRDKGIYSRKDYIRDAVEKIDNDGGTGYRREGEKLLAQSIRCGCGSEVSVSALGSTSGECPKCGAELVDLESEKDFEVID